MLPFIIFLTFYNFIAYHTNTFLIVDSGFKNIELIIIVHLKLDKIHGINGLQLNKFHFICSVLLERLDPGAPH